MKIYEAIATFILTFSVFASGQASSQAIFQAQDQDLPTIDFLHDGIAVIGTLRAGQQARLHYDPARAPCIASTGDGTYSATAKAFMIVNNRAQLLGTLIHDGLGPVVSRDLIFTIPSGFSILALYIDSTSYVGSASHTGYCHAYDSNHGTNWLFEVAS